MPWEVIAAGILIAGRDFFVWTLGGGMVAQSAILGGIALFNAALCAGIFAAVVSRRLPLRPLVILLIVGALIWHIMSPDPFFNSLYLMTYPFLLAGAVLMVLPNSNRWYASSRNAEEVSKP
jgi:hypothetical protein